MSLMNSRNSRINRRAVLRGMTAAGASVIVPLPRLCAMLNGNGTAYADGKPLPKYFGTWFFGNGVLPPKWVPTSTGSNWELSEQLAPLAKVKRSLTVVTGMKRVSGGFHSGGPPGVLTGASLVKSGGDPTVALPSIDQVIAEVIGKGLPFRSLEVGVCKATPNAAGSIYHAISHRGPDAPNPPEYDPRVIFDKLFRVGGPPAPGGQGTASELVAARASVLDAVAAEARSLSTSLGAEDRQRMERHLESVLSLEQRLKNVAPVACTPPSGSGGGMPSAGPDTKAEASPLVNEVMADLVTTALACDRTRVFSFVFTLPAAHVYFRHLGLNADFHDSITHGDPGDQPRVNKGVIYTMQSLAVLLEKLQAVPHGAGTLLDSTCVYATSCCAWGKQHKGDDYPLLLAGLAGGALRGNLHHRTATPDNPSKLLLTLANIYGAGLTTLGRWEWQAKAELPEIRRA